MPHRSIAPLCHPKRSHFLRGLCLECFQGLRATEAHTKPDEIVGPVYHPRKTQCLLCDRAFQSYDPRYNRRCPSCQTLVEHSGAFVADDEVRLKR